MINYLLKIPLLSLLILFNYSFNQELVPEVTDEKKKLLILTNENHTDMISEKIYLIASSVAVQLKRYEVIDRNQLEKILHEQKLQHSGIVNQNNAIELGQIASADEALLIRIQTFDQKGIPKEKKEKEEEEKNEVGFVGWLIKEVVKAEIDKATENIERYPNNIQTIVDCEIQLVNILTGKSIKSFSIFAEHVGGTKSKSLSKVMKKVRSKMIKELKNIYKLSSEVLDVRGNEVTLFLGKNMGIDSRSYFEILSRNQKKKIRNREVIIPGKSVGIVRVITVSDDASSCTILRNWKKIEPGYQAHEITDGFFTGGIAGVYGSTPKNMRLRFFLQLGGFNRLGGEVFGDVGTTQDTRGRDDFQFGFGGGFIWRFIKTSLFSFGPTLSLPIDFHTRVDDENSQGQSHWVFLPTFSPRLGLQSEIMLNSKIDLIFRAEYIISNISGKYWTYTEEKENIYGDMESKKWNANWEQSQGVKPEINYDGWFFTIGIRKISFSSFTFN